ncbi:LuxR C-terminal-related transcriptional regulator [Panacagrimonas sp.]|uniref:LuxR C-terminal-related transcriptional regulator n=1 Tax=Panacagrimonas sp. TaxID=2480088 RepID=UPI003B51AA98
MSKAAPTVIVADDHPLFGVALRLGVQRAAPDAQVVAVESFAGLREAITAHPDAALVLLDLMMPDVEGLSALQFLREQFPQVPVALVSAAGERHWVRSAEALGAVAFIPKATPLETTLEVIGLLLAGGCWWPQPESEPVTVASPASRHAPQTLTLEGKLERLTRQELRILLQIRDGQLNKQIAWDLGISESTVKTHISTLLRKLDLHTRTQAAVLAQRLLAGPQIVPDDARNPGQSATTQ